MTSLSFACPICHTQLITSVQNELQCPTDELTFVKINGIWRFLLPDQVKQFQAFIDLQKKQIDLASNPYNHSILSKKFSEFDPPLHILELGSGKGELSMSLAKQSHCIYAVDILTEGPNSPEKAAKHNETVTFLQADFDNLPLSSDHFDLIIFNASIHYSKSYINTLSETLRVLKQNGSIFIMNSPVFKQKNHGESYSKKETVQKGFNLLYSEKYLTYDWLNALAEILALEWKFDLEHVSLGTRFKNLLPFDRFKAQYPLIVGKQIANSKFINRLEYQ